MEAGGSHELGDGLRGQEQARRLHPHHAGAGLDPPPDGGERATCREGRGFTCGCFYRRHVLTRLCREKTPTRPPLPAEPSELDSQKRQSAAELGIIYSKIESSKAKQTE